MSDAPGRLGADTYDALDRQLAGADEDFARSYPGESGTRQPVHTVYVSADRYESGTARGWGKQAMDSFDRHAATPARLAAATGLSPELALAVHARVLSKLAREPIEDLRIDFEDGLGDHPDEDALAELAAQRLAESMQRGQAPPFTGIRFKSLEARTRRRGVRTLDVFLGALCQRYGSLPPGFVLTLPKVRSLEQATAMVALCERLESVHDIGAGALRFELQIETPQAVLGADGTATLARMVHATAGRCVGLHYGTYDYSSSLGVAAGYQSLEHGAADHAKAVMQVAVAGTGVRLSDGSTNVVPAGSPGNIASAWQLHARLVRRSLERGYYQGWDLHPNQLVTRYAATYAFFLDGLDVNAARLGAYLAGARSGVLDEPATAVALAGFLARGLDCGALDEDDVRDRTGVDRAALDALYLRS
ncbi:MAG: HpcH/HpaI aldolase/citrate lyase family protein [Actinomycetota bacterium]|nr:HpcH/HpaI aldolase/citrate lyase family protein [Actinomycetota bacterium]